MNVGRGNVIDENALFKGIKEGIISGAALDVWNKEPLSKDHPFYLDAVLNEKIITYCH